MARPKWYKQIDYLAYFYSTTARGMLRKQKLKFPSQTLSFQDEFNFKPRIKDDWYDLFNVKKNVNLEFTYYWPLVQRQLFELIDTLGANLKNVLHLAHEREFFPENGQMEVGRTYRLKSQLSDIVKTQRGKIVLVNESSVLGDSEQPLSTSRDFIFLNAISKSDLEKLDSLPIYNKTDVSSYMGGSRKESEIEKGEHKIFDVYIDEGFGTRYGRISGDLNPIHTSNLVAKSLGFKKAFVQGACTSNYIMKIFFESLDEKPKSISTTYCRPLYTNQKARLIYGPNKFEILDQNDKLAAYGNRTY